jgi:hypothetical protein
VEGGGHGGREFHSGLVWEKVLEFLNARLKGAVR